MRACRFCALLIAFIIPAFLLAQESTVTIPLDKYETLIKSSEKESVTVLQEVRLSGNFKESRIELTVKGQSTGSLPKVSFLKAGGAAAFSGCTGNAVLIPEDGSVALLPLAGAFSLTCTLRFEGAQRLDLAFLSPVLVLSTDISGGEIIRQGTPASQATLIISPTYEQQGMKTRPPVSSARYRISLLPNATSFVYQIALDNPNRSKVSHIIRLVNDEVVRSIQTTLPYREVQNTIQLELPPGVSQVSLEGTLGGSAFNPLMDAEEQYLVVENHPMLVATIQSDARRISAADTGMAYSYRSAQGFMLSPKDRVAWSVQKMEVFATLGYSIDAMEHLLYLPAAGKPILETHLLIQNQGCAQMEIEVPGKPLYMEYNKTAQMLTKDGKGRLIVPLTVGEQMIDIQYEAANPLRFWLFGGRNPMISMNAPVSEASVEVRTDKKWTPLASLYSRFFRFSFSWVIILAKLALCALILLYLLKAGYDPRARAAGAGLFFLLSLFSMAWLLIPLVWLGLLGIVALARKAKKKQDRIRILILALSGTLIVAIFIIFFGSTAILEFRRSLTTAGAGGIGGYSSSPLERLGGSLIYGMVEPLPPASRMIDNASRQMAREEREKASQPASVPVGINLPGQGMSSLYEGLPAKVTLPDPNGNELYFSESMVKAGKSMAVRYFIVPSFLLSFFHFILILMVAAWIWKSRIPLGTAMKAAFEDALDAPPPPKEGDL